LKDSFVVVHDGAGLAVHEVAGADDATSEGLADGLMTEAYAQHWNPSREVANQFDADAGLAGRAGSGRNDNAFWTHRFYLLHRDLVVAADFNFLTQFADVLDQVVGKGIVVIEYENQAPAPDISLHRPKNDCGLMISDFRLQAADQIFDLKSKICDLK
jgi:hypothetical protein